LFSPLLLWRRDDAVFHNVIEKGINRLNGLASQRATQLPLMFFVSKALALTAMIITGVPQKGLFPS
jgi:hypothetical protein